MMSIRTRSISGLRRSSSIPSRPFSAYRTSMPCVSRTLVSAKTFRTSSSTMDLLVLEDLLRRMKLLEEAPPLLRELPLDSMEAERRLVEQALPRAGVLDHDRV